MELPVFKVGDRVRYKFTYLGGTDTALGTIVGAPKTARGEHYDVAFDEGTVLNGMRYGPTHTAFDVHVPKDKWQLGPVVIPLEFLESANESPVTATSK